MIKRFTDEDIINRVRHAEKYRRVYGWCFAVAGFFAMGCLVYLMHDFRQKCLSIFASRSDTPTTQQTIQLQDTAKFNMGLVLGFGMAGGWAGAVALATTGIMHLLGLNRKDRLLLKLSDRKTNHRDLLL